MSTQPKTLLTPEEYLAIERKAEYKSEYYDGVMYAMAGARAPHDLIAWNLHRELGNAFHSRPCRGFTSDMRVRPVARHYTYPDSSALCGEPRFVDERQDTLLNPSLIVEVLSPSTEAYDRGRNSNCISPYRHFANIYCSLPTESTPISTHGRGADSGCAVPRAGWKTW
jgi:Uma2 family endonuclease